jgi:hypothetical protein
MSNVFVQDLFTGIDLIGVLANAILGGLVARAERMHPVGLIALAILSGARPRHRRNGAGRPRRWPRLATGLAHQDMGSPEPQ